MSKRHGGSASAAKSALLWAQAKQSTCNNSVKFHGGKSRQSIEYVTFDPRIVCPQSQVEIAAKFRVTSDNCLHNLATQQLLSCSSDLHQTFTSRHILKLSTTFLLTARPLDEYQSRDFKKIGPTCAPSFVDFLCKFSVKRSLRSKRGQKTFVRAFKQLPNDMQMNQIGAAQVDYFYF